MDYAFLVHSRDYTDVYRKFKIAKFLPRKVIEFYCLHAPPILIAKILNFKSKKTNKNIKGYVIAIPMTAKQMIENRELARKKIIQAINKAEKLGVKIVGLGALTSSISGGGELIKGNFNIKITSGIAYTSFIVTSYVLKAINEFLFDKNKVKIAIVGAAGSVGSNCAKILARKKIKNILLIDVYRKNKIVQNLIKELYQINPQIEILFSHTINDIKKSDIIIAATNAPEALIKEEDLKKGAIIIDDAQPSDISPEIVKQRDDVLIVDGGVVSVPDINIKFNFGLASKNNIFSCLGEVMIIASMNKILNYQNFKIDTSIINEIEKMSKFINFKIENFQRFGKIYDNQKIKKLKKIINKVN